MKTDEAEPTLSSVSGPAPMEPKAMEIATVDKFVKLSSRTINADKFFKLLGFGCGTAGHCLPLLNRRQDTELTESLKKLASQITMARYVVRFTGAFESYEAIKNDSWCYPDDDHFLKSLVKLEGYSMLLYYPLEHIAFIGYVAPKLLKVDADKYSRHSCAMWTLFVAMDLYANHLRIQKLNARERKLMADKDAKEEEKAKQLASVRSQRRELYYVQLRNLCYFPTCVHWSLPNGLLPEPIVQLLSFIEAVVGFWRSWKAM